MTLHKIESGRDRASGNGGPMPEAAGAGCPARARFHQAVAPQSGVKGGLRHRLSTLGRSGVQGTPRLVMSFSRRNERPAPNWGGPLPRSAVREVVDFVTFVVAITVPFLLALHVAMGGGA